MSRSEVADRPAPGVITIVRRDRPALGGACLRTLSQHLNRSPELDQEVTKIPNGVGTTLESR